MIGAGYNALAGEYGLAWQVVSWGLTVVVELMGLLAGLSLLTRKLGRRRAYSPSNANPPATSEEVLAHDTSDSGAVENRQETVERGETEPENGKTLATWLPHPDDPAQAGASQPPEEKRKTTLTPPSHPPT
jgi:hypothetical protein